MKNSTLIVRLLIAAAIIWLVWYLFFRAKKIDVSITQQLKDPNYVFMQGPNLPK